MFPSTSYSALMKKIFFWICMLCFLRRNGNMSGKMQNIALISKVARCFAIIPQKINEWKIIDNIDRARWFSDNVFPTDFCQLEIFTRVCQLFAKNITVVMFFQRNLSVEPIMGFRIKKYICSSDLVVFREKLVKVRIFLLPKFDGKVV